MLSPLYDENEYQVSLILCRRGGGGGGGEVKRWPTGAESACMVIYVETYYNMPAKKNQLSYGH